MNGWTHLHLGGLDRQGPKAQPSLGKVKKRKRTNKFKKLRVLFELGKSHYLLADHRKAIELFIRALEEQQRRGKNHDWASL